MTPLQELTEAIITFVPEIRELKFGCKLLTPKKQVVSLSHMVQHEPGERKVYDNGSVFSTKTKGYTDFICIKEDGSIYNYGMFGKEKIIGRDITLADVLSTIGQLFGEYGMSLRVWGNEIAKINFGKDTIEWHLSEPLQEQPQGTINFLHSIIST